MALLLLALLLLLGAYFDSFSSMVSVWARSETFAHGFIILPIFFWLIWRIREKVVSTVPRANFLGLPLLIFLGFIWLLAKFVGVLVVEQLAATMMIPALVFSLLGWQTTVVMIFPLLFLIFSVPIGEELTPYLIDFTADFTVALINIVGIPIYREGNFFQLPTGSWSVVAACSGVRYLIASVTLGALYAYLNYHWALKRVIFIALSFVVPIFANGLRAFMIVMIGHYSDMQLATGIDHLIYGWIFFGIVISIMFYIGSFWTDHGEPSVRSVNFNLGDLSGFPGASIGISVAAILISLVWPVYYMVTQEQQDFSVVTDIHITNIEGWKESSANKDVWKPAFEGFDREYLANFTDKNGNEVIVYIGYYAKQRQGAEIGNYNNVLVKEDDKTWKAVHENEVYLPELEMNVPAAIIQGLDRKYFTTYFYYANGQWVTDKYQTKLLQVESLLLGGREDAAVIALSAHRDESIGSEVELLKQFSKDALGRIKQAIDKLQNP